MDEYTRRSFLPASDFEQFKRELTEFRARRPDLASAPRSEILAQWMSEADDRNQNWPQ